ncbi:AbiV family abortive infection protein [Marinobacter nauticus]|uniref:AbiV family abortive infection protein n=1 Tax=Marinobacter nauticus TaxID=2743 RepID=A0A368WZI3_MARNT|nr:AbiV family abortive infection protein [Marinobacter nauticus]RCW60975.1 AbiV family abortive infection protein [Marinobacter nauticus]
MKKEEGVSKYKLNRIATEALRNAIRLHFDSILLYENGSFPSAFQLSVLALEEFSKANWVDHYIWTSETNEGYEDAEFEQGWLKLLYLHPAKQWNFVARETDDYSPNFVSLIQNRQLEEKKQNSIYVGLSRAKGKIDADSRISTPWRIKQKDARQVISIINDELLRICRRIEEDEFYFEGGKDMDDVFDYEIYKKILKWPHKSGLKNDGWRKRNLQRN